MSSGGGGSSREGGARRYRDRGGRGARAVGVPFCNHPRACIVAHITGFVVVCRPWCVRKLMLGRWAFLLLHPAAVM